MPETKDTEWESYEDRVQASIEVDAKSPKQVKQLLSKARHSVAAYIRTMAQGGNEVPSLESLSGNGIAWDWMKTC